ncbi:MAG TPA: LLM class flavin-dependent oxidoreductase [Stellaceae bacterium]|nr:LLM class flavin-dependent oxidoreductase [Stellaceae bacterium]
MEYGIALATQADSWKLVKRAEELGYTAAGFFDTQMLNADVFVAMAAAAMQTKRIKLVTNVLIPSNRIAPSAACALASLNALAPGRVEFGVSTGFTGRRTMGLKRIKQADLREYIRVTQALLRGETPEWDFEGKRRKIRFLTPEIGAINIKDEIPLFISATGPRARGLVAELGAGWICPLGRARSAFEALADMKAKWQAARRNLEDLHVHGEIGGAVLRDGEAYGSERIKDEAGPSAMLLIHDLVEEEMQDRAVPSGAFPPAFTAAFEKYKALYARMEPADARYLANHVGHLMFLKPEERALCTGDLIRDFSWTAPKAELRERLKALKEAGFSRVSVQIRHTRPSMLEDWWDVFESV